jgi:arabinogalactan endo-1,4-beta-galactosidase
MKFLILWMIFSVLLFSCSKKGGTSNDDKRVFYSTSEFVMGADLSNVNQVLDHGGVYRDSSVIEDPYTVFSQYGANVIRFRLFYNPQWSAEAYTPPAEHMYCDYDDVKRGMTEAKAQGMAACLDFHYSDSWADPSKQVPPEAWSSLTLTELHDSVYQYTYKTLARLNAAGLMPEYVQVGNEINPGFLLPAGNRWNSKADFIYLLNSAISAVRAASSLSGTDTKIIIHISKPENVAYWFDGMTSSGLTDYDIIGISYYYMWSTVALDDLSTYINNIRTQFGKDVMIMETCYPWTTDWADSYGNIIDATALVPGYPATTTGQYNYLVKLVQEVADGGGIGIFYWEPAWISSNMKDLWGKGSSWECNTLFDFIGNVNKGMDYMTCKYNF